MQLHELSDFIYDVEHLTDTAAHKMPYKFKLSLKDSRGQPVSGLGTAIYKGFVFSNAHR